MREIDWPDKPRNAEREGPKKKPKKEDKEPEPTFPGPRERVYWDPPEKREKGDKE